MAVLKNKQNNSKTIHTGGGYISATIEFYINEQLVKKVTYNNKAKRQKLIDAFRSTYPPHRNQVRSFIIKPNWDLWHSKEK